jgi:formate hydrogenlyase transcriptional activator
VKSSVRELENLIERALIVSSGATLEVGAHWLQADPMDGAIAPARPTLAESERHTIREALDRCHGKIYGPGGAAAALGLKPTTLYGKMRKHGIANHRSSP